MKRDLYLEMSGTQVMNKSGRPNRWADHSVTMGELAALEIQELS